jgi:pimeloyl-ACP methyl ester carboxylesterase
MWPVKLVASPIFLIVSILMIDSGLGIIDRDRATVETVVANDNHGTPSRTIIAIAGYNGHGDHLVAALAPGLEGDGTLVSFEYGTEAYDNELVLLAIEEALRSYPADEIVVEGESYGGMLIAEVLRRNPDLHLKGLVLNATPSSAADIKILGNGLKVASLLPGGPLSTFVLQQQQKQAVQGGSSPEPGVDPVEAQAAFDDSTLLTAPWAIGQLRTMAYFEPPHPGEFEGRVDNVRFVHAPDPSSEGDALIHLAQASAAWKAAFSDAHFLDVAVDSWEVGMHTPTSERPSGLVEQIKATYI